MRSRRAPFSLELLQTNSGPQVWVGRLVMVTVVVRVKWPSGLHMKALKAQCGPRGALLWSVIVCIGLARGLSHAELVRLLVRLLETRGVCDRLMTILTAIRRLSRLVRVRRMRGCNPALSTLPANLPLAISISELRASVIGLARLI